MATDSFDNASNGPVPIQDVRHGPRRGVLSKYGFGIPSAHGAITPYPSQLSRLARIPLNHSNIENAWLRHDPIIPNGPEYGIMSGAMKSYTVTAKETPSILCLDFAKDTPGQRMALDGIRRHAKARGWGVASFSRDDLPDVGAVPPLLARLRPIGCIICDFWGDGRLPPRLFGRLPVVYFDSPGGARWRGAAAVVCDNAAVARAAFEELAAGLPECYAFVPSTSLRPWA